MGEIRSGQNLIMSLTFWLPQESCIPWIHKKEKVIKVLNGVCSDWIWANIMRWLTIEKIVQNYSLSGITWISPKNYEVQGWHKPSPDFSEMFLWWLNCWLGSGVCRTYGVCTLLVCYTWTCRLSYLIACSCHALAFGPWFGNNSILYNSI